MTTRRVAITGMGLISPLSLSLETFWSRLISEQGAVQPFLLPGAADSGVPPLFVTIPSVAAPALFDGDIDEFAATDTVQKKAIKKALKVMSREIQMAVAASCHALNHANIHIGQFAPDRQGISFGSDYILTTVEDVIDGIRACCRAATDGKTFDFARWAPVGMPKMSPLWQLKYLPNMPASHIAIFNNFHGPSNSITLREASIGAVMAESMEIIRSGRADIMLVGTTGSRLHPIKMIQAIQQEEISPDCCRPFDRDRNGTVLGEGAGAIVLEDWEHAQKRDATIHAEVVAASSRARRGCCQTALESVLADVFRKSQIEPRCVGHVSAHGLGSRAADHLEAAAIAKVFSNKHGGGKHGQSIPVMALKGFFGNLGAGAGTIELIASVLAMKKGHLPPSLHCNQPDEPLALSRGHEMPAGDSCVKIAFNHQAQASAVLLKRAT